MTEPVEDQLKAGFPDGRQITFRTPPVVAVHSEAVTVDLALHIDGPAFYNPDANIGVAWELSARGPAWNNTATADPGPLRDLGRDDHDRPRVGRLHPLRRC